MVFTVLTQHTLEGNLKAIKDASLQIQGSGDKQTQSTKSRHTCSRRCQVNSSCLTELQFKHISTSILGDGNILA